MPRAVALLAVGGVLGLMGLWLTDSFVAVADWAQAGQRAAQDQMAMTLRALHAGTPGALAGLWGLCFVYGFVHAMGPGHGKLVVGAYGIGTNASLVRLGGIAMLGALGQALTAILLVLGGAALLGLTRAGMEQFATRWLDRAALWAVLALGLWLVLRGVRAFWRSRPVKLDHGAQEICTTCGHRHAPDPAIAAHAQTWREMAAVIGAIALRPCTGALFVLLLTWRMELVWQGVGGVLAMALGTGMVTVAAALFAGSARRTAFAMPAIAGLAPALAPMIEILAGSVIALLALNMLNSA